MTEITLQRQQAGRAGRRSKDSLVVLVAESFAVDQYYANHPEELFDGKLDELMVDVDSKVVLEGASTSPSIVYIPNGFQLIYNVLDLRCLYPRATNNGLGLLCMKYARIV